MEVTVGMYLPVLNRASDEDVWRDRSKMPFTYLCDSYFGQRWFYTDNKTEHHRNWHEEHSLGHR